MLLIFMVIILYFLQSLLLLIGLAKNHERVYTDSPLVTVIVAAKNEEENIVECLRSLERLHYPESKLEIFIVNDGSTDRTGALIQEFIDDHPAFKYIFISKRETGLTGKANAISQALEVSRGEFVFITDADCIVPPAWLNETLSYFKPDIGMVAGFSHVVSENPFAKIQNLDWMYLLSVASGASAYHLPLSCIGNNFAFRKSTYDDVGGYNGVGYSLTEDFALLREISLKTDWQICFPLNHLCAVISRPEKNHSSFFRQRKRWALGGIPVRFTGKYLIVLSVLAHTALFIALSRPNFFLSALGMIVTADLLLMSYTAVKLKNVRQLFYYPVYKIFFCYYMFILPILMLIDRKVIWKDAVYK